MENIAFAATHEKSTMEKQVTTTVSLTETNVSQATTTASHAAVIKKLSNQFAKLKQMGENPGDGWTRQRNRQERPDRPKVYYWTYGKTWHSSKNCKNKTEGCNAVAML